MAVAQAKILTTEVALEASERLLELAGASATRDGYNLGRYWRDARVHTLHDPVRWKYHLLGNHLLENGIALAFTGACFEGPDAARWLATGLGILREQLPEQILADGMHFERSPMYQIRLAHSVMAEDGGAAGGRVEERDECTEGRAFPRAIGSQQAKNLACIDLEGNVIDSLVAVVGFAEPTDVDGDRAIHYSQSFVRCGSNSINWIRSFSRPAR